MIKLFKDTVKNELLKDIISKEKFIPRPEGWDDISDREKAYCIIKKYNCPLEVAEKVVYILVDDVDRQFAISNKLGEEYALYVPETLPTKLRVWWVPQIGMVETPFYIPVKTVEEGKKVIETLSAYDAYQLQNEIKSDYTNTGGLEMYDPEFNEWTDWFYEDDEEYIDDVDEYLETSENLEEIEEFTEELFSQIDWDKIEEITG